MNLKRSNNGLEYLEISSVDSKSTIVMMHGFGANCRDLVGLQPFMDPSLHYRWIFPNGVLKLPDYGSDARAWFPIRISELEAAAKISGKSKFTTSSPEGLSSARDRILELLSELSIDPSQLILGGFSQGAMMATEITSTLPMPTKGLMIFSGTLVNSDLWTTSLNRHKGTPFFQSHGDSDPILGIDYALMLNQVLSEAGLLGELHRFRGGHEIPLSALKLSTEFLKKLRSL